MDYYSILGLKRGATEAEIKKAYRSMAMKHHPDRGGDEKKFKEISAAYEVLSDPQKKQMYDMGVDPNQQGGGFHNQGPFEFHFGSGNFEDIFHNFGFGFGQRPMRKNKTLSINVEIDLEDVLKGKDIDAQIGIPGGQLKNISIAIPPGIETGQQIRYQGMGDHSLKDVRPGDLIVNVIVRNNPNFRREHDNLIVERIIDVWDAIIGTSIEIETLDKKKLSINVPPGTQPDTVLSCKSEGLPNMRTKIRGNLLIKIKIGIPKNLTASQIEKVKNFKNGL